MVVAPEDVDAFIAAAESENLEAYRVAVVTEEARMVMEWNGTVIADLSRDFLNTNGAVKHAGVRVAEKDRTALAKPRFQSLREMASSLKCASRRGLVERFDSTIGAGSILMPFGGRTQRTPAQAMAAVFPVLPGQETDQASVMAWGCDPEQTCTDPYTGAYNAVYTSMAKLVSAGADYKKAYPFRSSLRSSAMSRSAGASPSPLCWALWTRSWSWAPPPLAVRTPCPAPSWIWTYRPR